MNASQSVEGKDQSLEGKDLTFQWSLISNNRHFKEITLSTELALLRNINEKLEFWKLIQLRKLLLRLDVPAWAMDTEFRLHLNERQSAGVSVQVYVRDDLLVKFACFVYDKDRKTGLSIDLASQVIKLLNAKWQVESESVDWRSPSSWELSCSWGADAKHFASVLSYELSDGGLEARVRSSTTPRIDRSGLAITWRPASNEYRFAIALDIPDTTDVQWLAIQGGRVSTGTVYS